MAYRTPAIRQEERHGRSSSVGQFSGAAVHAHRGSQPATPRAHSIGYREMPGLRLTLVQARRLWALDILTCSAALATLQAAGFLDTTRDGAFILADADRMSA